MDAVNFLILVLSYSSAVAIPILFLIWGLGLAWRFACSLFI